MGTQAQVGTKVAGAIQLSCKGPTEVKPGWVWVGMEQIRVSVGPAVDEHRNGKIM